MSGSETLQAEGTSSSDDVGLICAGRSSPAVAGRALAAPSATFTSGASAFFIPRGAEGGL